jgi:hypothetical protein
LAIHHLEHERKRSLYRELFEVLEPGGMFANFEHVASSTHRLTDDIPGLVAVAGNFDIDIAASAPREHRPEPRLPPSSPHGQSR